MFDLFQPIFKQIRGKHSKEAVSMILSEIKAKPQQYLLGNRRIYMNEEVEQTLNRILIEYDKLRVKSINVIKKFYRKIKLR